MSLKEFYNKIHKEEQSPSKKKEKIDTIKSVIQDAADRNCNSVVITDTRFVTFDIIKEFLDAGFHIEKFPLNTEFAYVFHW